MTAGGAYQGTAASGVDRRGLRDSSRTLAGTAAFAFGAFLAGQASNFPRRAFTTTT
jgi:hypothetical protein